MSKPTKTGSERPQFRERLRDWTPDFFKQEFDSLGSRLQSQAFARFYVEQVHNATQSEIDAEDFDAAWVDAAGDLNIDLLHRDDGRVFILQSRYHRQEYAEQASNISHFQNVLARLRNGDFKPNSRLSDLASAIDWDNDSFILVYLTLGKLAGQAQLQADAEPVYPPDVDGLELRCDWRFLGESELNVELRNAIQIRAGVPDTELVIHAAGPKGHRSEVIEIESGEYTSYVVVVDAPQIIHAYLSCGRDAIFTMNVRSFIGNTKYNKKIVGTATEHPAEFFFFNNGISCIAESVDRAKDRITVRRLQVINGAQTIRSLLRAQRSSDWNTIAPLILMRVTDVGPYYKAGSKIFRENITRYNNTQNVVKDSDFRSNDIVQSDLKEQFSRLRRSGKQCVYVPKRTDDIKRDAEVIRLEEFAKTVFSCLDNPAKFSGSTSYLFDDMRGYPVVFIDGDSPMPPGDFRLRAAIWWMGKEFGAQIKKDRNSQPSQALERKWLLVHAARLFLERFYGNQWQDKLSRHYEGNWELGKGKLGLAFKLIYDLARAAVVYKYNMDSQSTSFVHRNWMRSEKTAEQLRVYVEMQPIIEQYIQAISPLG